MSSDWRYRPSRSVRNDAPGRVDIEPTDDEEWPFYWTVYVDGERVNGGLCTGTADGIARARRAVEVWRRQWFLRHNTWDHVTSEWFERDVPLPLYSL
jgi:hypothetical protein